MFKPNGAPPPAPLVVEWVLEGLLAGVWREVYRYPDGQYDRIIFFAGSVNRSHDKARIMMRRGDVYEVFADITRTGALRYRKPGTPP